MSEGLSLCSHSTQASPDQSTQWGILGLFTCLSHQPGSEGPRGTSSFPVSISESWQPLGLGHPVSAFASRAGQCQQGHAPSKCRREKHSLASSGSRCLLTCLSLWVISQASHRCPQRPLPAPCVRVVSYLTRTPATVVIGSRVHPKSRTISTTILN